MFSFHKCIIYYNVYSFQCVKLNQRWGHVPIFLSLVLQSPCSSGGSVTGCQSRGCEFESQFDQHSFWRLTTSLWQDHTSSTNGLSVYVEKQPVAWKKCCMEYWCEKAKKHMSRWTGGLEMTEKLLKTALNWNQSINPFFFSAFFSSAYTLKTLTKEIKCEKKATHQVDFREYPHIRFDQGRVQRNIRIRRLRRCRSRSPINASRTMHSLLLYILQTLSEQGQP